MRVVQRTERDARRRRPECRLRASAPRRVPREPRGGPAGVARALRERRDRARRARLPGLARLLERLPRQRPRQRHAATVGRRRPRRLRTAHRAASPTSSCSAASPPRWRSSRRTACTAISRRGSTRSARSRVGDPALDPLRLEPQLTPELQARIPASVLRVHVAGETLAEALPRLQETYCGTMAYEIEHISDARAARVAAPGDRVVALPHSR